MRQIILLAGAPKGTLQEEAAILKQYLDLERLRFEDKFDYTINVPDNMVLVNVTVPAMVLYHLVENIIYSRALNSLNPVHIKINFEYRHDCICFTVEDNAVLAVAAGMHHPTQPNKLAEQVQMLNENNNGTIWAELRDHDNNAGGQVVEVKFYIEAGVMEELAA